MFGKSKKPKYYSLSGILEKNADYNIIFGERSNGKTYACLAYMIINYVETGDADCGFVYRTDALLLDEENGVIVEDVDSSLHDPIVYPAAIMKDAPQAESAADFYEFLQTDFAKEVFEKYGFNVK